MFMNHIEKIQINFLELTETVSEFVQITEK